jgi:hypothetical protein
VDNLYYLEADPAAVEARCVVFVVQPRPEACTLVASAVRSLSRRARAASQPPRDFTVLFAPRRSLACDKALEEAGVLGDCTLGEVALHWLPLERDVALAPGATDAVRDAARDGDAAGLLALARALHSLQRSTTGLVPFVRGKGVAARQLADALLRLRREDGAAGAAPAPQGSGAPPPGWGAPALMVLLDRATDWVTPLCTQLTYEGLIDEILGIKNGTVTLPASTAPDGTAVAARKARLNSSDALFAELRDANFGRACDALRDKTAALASDYRALKGPQGAAAEVSEIGGFVKRLRDNMGGAGVDLHATIARCLLDSSKSRGFMRRLDCERTCVEGGAVDDVLDHIETLCHRGAPLVQPLRLLCLATLTSGGLPVKRAEALRRELIHAYGARHVTTLGHLANAGLLPPPGPPASGGGALSAALGAAAAGVAGARGAAAVAAAQGGFPAARGPLRLCVEGLNDAAPDDIAYTYSHSGYAPLSVRLAAQAARPGGFHEQRSIEDAVRQLPGPAFELAQGTDAAGAPAELPLDPVALDAALMAASLPGRLPPVLVVFVGGVTYAELSALRFLSRPEGEGGAGRAFVALSGSLCSGDATLTALLAAEDTPRPDAPAV